MDYIASLQTCIEGTHVVDNPVPAKVIRSVLMLLLLAVGQPPPVPKNVLNIHEISILVPLSSRALLTSIQDLVHPPNNNFFQAYV
jgi:hypothetical protein